VLRGNQQLATRSVRKETSQRHRATQRALRDDRRIHWHARRDRGAELPAIDGRAEGTEDRDPERADQGRGRLALFRREHRRVSSFRNKLRPCAPRRIRMRDGGGRSLAGVELHVVVRCVTTTRICIRPRMLDNA
jgi:hypothetical protein